MNNNRGLQTHDRINFDGCQHGRSQDQTRGNIHIVLAIELSDILSVKLFTWLTSGDLLARRTAWATLRPPLPCVKRHRMESCPYILLYSMSSAVRTLEAMLAVHERWDGVVQSVPDWADWRVGVYSSWLSSCCTGGLGVVTWRSSATTASR
jgi:hypothetical protein